MPEINNAAHLRERAINFRRLAKDYDEAGQRPVSDKLTAVAVDFDAQAAELDRSEVSARTPGSFAYRLPLGVVLVSSKVGTSLVTPSERASILVLDDDAGFRRFLVQALGGAGYSVVDSGDANP